MKRNKEGEMKFQACTLEIHREMHPNFLFVKNFATGERDISPHQVSQFLLLQAFHVDIPKHTHYYTLLISKLFFSLEKILISKLHYINEHKLIKTLGYKFLVLFSQLQSLETFIEFRNYYFFRISQVTNKPS